MSAAELIYYLLVGITVVFGLGVLFSKNTIYSAISLVGVMICLAANFLLMHLEFVAFIQIIVYAGAIMVLFLFVIMLLNLREKENPPWFLRKARRVGTALCLIFLFLVGAGLKIFAVSTAEDGVPGAVRQAEASVASGIPEVVVISTMMVTKYSLPFLLTSVLLLVAVIGAISMARRKDEDGREIILED